MLNRHQKETNVSKEVWVYISRSVAKNTSIGVAIISDEDSDMNGSIGTCTLKIAGSSTNVSPLYLDEIRDEAAATSDPGNYYSPYSQRLNYEISSIMAIDYLSQEKTRSSHRSTNLKRFLIRTGVELAAYQVNEQIEMELTATDNGES